MGPMSVTEFNSAQRAEMLSLARESLVLSLAGTRPELPDLDLVPDYLGSLRACFVTLESEGRLRGCIGSLDAHRPLGHDLVLNAVSSAMHDYRFEPLRPDEPVKISVSVLSLLKPLIVDSESELLSVLQPGIDGVVFQAGARRSTFLPVVWQSLVRPDEFMAELKRKAGLPGNYWSDAVRIWRYHTESFGEEREVPIAAIETGTK